MKKTIKALLLAVLVVCTVCVLTVMASATEVPTSGYVKMYETDGTVPTERTETELTWKVETVGEDVVLTIDGEDTTLTFNSAASWIKMSTETIPWWSHAGSITKVVINAPITKITQACAFNKLTKVHTFVLPDTQISINNQLSMPFANMTALSSFGPEGTPENTIDLRNFTHTGSQAFEGCCAGKDVTVLMPYVGAAPLGTAKVFTKTTTATFMVLKNSAGHTYAAETYPAATTNIYMPASNISIDFYTGLVIEGETTDGITGWSLDVDSGALTVTNLVPGTSKWEQFESKDSAWVSFASGWKNYVKNATVTKFEKFAAEGSESFLSGSTTLETVTFAAGQRFLNNSSKGWFQGCTALKAVTIGGTLETGVADLSGASIDGQDEPGKWLTNIFNGCDDIVKIILPTDVDLVTFPASAITGCTALTEIVIGANITEIEETAFDAWINSTEGYSALTVTFTDTNSALGLALKEKEAGLLSVVVPTVATSGQVDGDATNDNDLTWSLDVATGKLTIEGTSTSIVWVGGKNAGWNGTTNQNDFSMIPWYTEYNEVIKSIEIKASVTSVPSATFGGLANLETVIFPASCTALGNMAFVGCAALKEVQTAGVDVPANVIDLRNFTGSNDGQIFENALDGSVTIYLPRTATKLNLNAVFGRSTTKAHFVVYPGSIGEENAYNMINNRSTNRVYGEFTYSYYTEAQASEWYAEYMATTSCTYTSGSLVTNHEFDIETGIVTVTGSGYDCFMNQAGWKTMLSTWKYAIKEVHILHGGKTTWQNGSSEGKLTGLPELTTVILNCSRQQASPLYSNNPKLTTFGTASNVAEGVINLKNWNDMNNGGLTGVIGSSMFANNPAITKVILPGNPNTSYSIVTLGANVFANCTGLTTIVIPENCTITSVDAAAFTGLTAPVMIINEAADTTVADLLLAEGVLPEGSYLYEEPANSAEGLTAGIVFDGWKVRLSGYNGLRGVFYYDNDVTAANEDNGWTLVEYGALLATTAKKNALGTTVFYDPSTGKSSVENHLRYYPTYTTTDGVGAVTGKTLNGSDVEADTNGTYFAISVIKYDSNYTTEVYMAGYEIWTKDGEVVIMYTDYATDEDHDAALQDASIYEVSMGMYMNGIINDTTDAKDIVWNTMVAGGALVLEEGTDYELTNDLIEGDITDLNGNAFGSTFTLVNVPAVKTTNNTTDKSLSFSDSDTTLSVFAHPTESGKYVLVYGSNGGDTTVGCSPYGNPKYFNQMSTDWFGAATTVANKLPNPVLTVDYWGKITHVVLDKGIKTVNGSSFHSCGVQTVVYSEDLTTLGNTAFQSANSLKTMYKAGTAAKDIVIGRVDVHTLKVGNNWVFNGCNGMTELWLREDIIIDAEFAVADSLTTLWLGDISNRVEGTINLTNATALTAIGGKGAFMKVNATILALPASVTSIHTSNVFLNSSITTVTQPVAVEAVQTVVVDTYGLEYIVQDSLAGWSNILVK